MEWVLIKFLLIIVFAMKLICIEGLLLDIGSDQNNREPIVPALFILGDSIFDAGNNNRLHTLAKVDYYPYGMDFPGGAPTGRFANGYNPADFIAFKLGLPLVPAYHNLGTKGNKLLQGVNFASGGSGIESSTGKLYGQVVSLEEQIENLRKVKEEITELIGGPATKELFQKAPFVVVTGSNDWLLSYFGPIIPNIHVHHISIEENAIRLIQKLISHIKDIYEVGARKIVVSGLPALGCCPSQLLEYKSNGSCVDRINDVAKYYNEHLLSEVLALNQELDGATIIFINIYTTLLDAAQDPRKFGFKIGNQACCGIGKYKGFLTCLHGLKPCDNVEDHLYWDAYHPTSNFYPFLIANLWNNGPPYTYPRSLKDEFESNQEDGHDEL